MNKQEQARYDHIASNPSVTFKTTGLTGRYMGRPFILKHYHLDTYDENNRRVPLTKDDIGKIVGKENLGKYIAPVGVAVTFSSPYSKTPENIVFLNLWRQTVEGGRLIFLRDFDQIVYSRGAQGSIYSLDKSRIPEIDGLNSVIMEPEKKLVEILNQEIKAKTKEERKKERWKVVQQYLSRFVTIEPDMDLF